MPIGVSSVHLILNGLAGLFLGWAVFPAFLIALALQVLFFSFGGFAVLGVNLCNISIPALLVYYLFRNSLRPAESGTSGLSRGNGGVIGTLGTVCLTSLALVLDSGKSYIDLVWLLFIGHLPIFVTDSLISVGILLALAKMRPASLMVNQPAAYLWINGCLLTGACFLLFSGLFCSAVSGRPTGLLPVCRVLFCCLLSAAAVSWAVHC